MIERRLLPFIIIPNLSISLPIPLLKTLIFTHNLTISFLPLSYVL